MTRKMTTTGESKELPVCLRRGWMQCVYVQGGVAVADGVDVSYYIHTETQERLSAA